MTNGTEVFEIAIDRTESGSVMTRSENYPILLDDDYLQFWGISGLYLSRRRASADDVNDITLNVLSVIKELFARSASRDELGRRLQRSFDVSMEQDRSRPYGRFIGEDNDDLGHGEFFEMVAVAIVGVLMEQGARKHDAVEHVSNKLFEMTGFSTDRLGSLFVQVSDSGNSPLDRVLRRLDADAATKEALRSVLGTTQALGRSVSWSTEDLMYRDIHLVNSLINKLSD